MCRSSVWRSLLPPPRPESDRDIRRSETFFSAVRSCPAATNLPPARSTKNAKPRDTRDRHRDREYREVDKSERETETARRETEGKRQRQRQRDREIETETETDRERERERQERDGQQPKNKSDAERSAAGQSHPQKPTT